MGLVWFADGLGNFNTRGAEHLSMKPVGFRRPVSFAVGAAMEAEGGIDPEGLMLP